MKGRHKLVDVAIAYGVIEEKDRPIYALAFSSLIFSLFTWGSLLILGMFFKRIGGCLVFLLFHIPLRIYAGGYHQNTKCRCYIQSLVIFLALLVGSEFTLFNWTLVHWVVFMVPAIVVIWFLSPVEALNKPLDYAERTHHKIISRMILFTETMFLAIFLINNLHGLMYYSCLSIQLVAFELILGFGSQRLLSH